MALIEKAKETMSPKRRIKETFEFNKTDRVPIGYEANAAIHRKLCSALSIAHGDDESLYDALGVDYRGIEAPYAGPNLFAAPENRSVHQLEGSVTRWIEHETGGYWDFCDFPLKDACDEAFDKFPVPCADDFDYDASLAKAKRFGDKYALFVGSPGVPDIINSNGRIMGMEDVLCHLMLESEAAMGFINRRVEFQFRMMERQLEKCRGLIDFIWLGEDLGTQIAPMVSLELYRRAIKPAHKKFAELASAHKIPAMIHTCGSSSWAYEDFIEMGIRCVDTLQPEAVNMRPEYLVKNFGGRLNFRGCVSTAGPLAYGTAEETAEDCKNVLDIMMPARGYHFAPTHCIQDNSPVENVIEMYRSIHKYGRY